MEESKLIQKIKEGDFTAFEEWMGNYYRNLERFAFQNGCSQKQAAEIVEDTFREIFKDPNNFDGQMRNMYKIVLDKIAHLQLSAFLLDDVFGFEEDAELHSVIIKLDEKYRVPLVLQVFHGLDDGQVAAHTDVTTSEAGLRIRAAKELVGKAINEQLVDRLEKRFELLEKSYNRLPVLFNADNVRREPTSFESIPIMKERKKLGRKGWITTIILGLLLLGLVGSTYFTGEEWELRSDRKYIDKLKKDFADNVDEKQEILGVSDDLFSQIPFITEANDQFKSLLVGLESKNSEGEKIDRQLADDWLLEINEMMKVPSELTDELFAAPLVNDSEKSMMFVAQYIEKAYVIKYLLYELYADDYDKLRESLAKGTFEAELISSKNSVYSDSTRRAITTLISQNVGLVWHDDALESNTNNAFIEQLRGALHEAAGSYLTQYEKEPFTRNEKLLYSLEETIGFIEEMEKTLDEARQNQWIGHSVEGTMINLLETMLQGRTIEEFKGSDGSISEVHRNAWKQLASLGPESGVGVIMTKIVEEMEASGWSHSELHSSLDDWRIYEAYTFAVEGNLEHFGLKPMGEMYEDLTFMLPSSQLDDVFANLYDEFSVAYDRDVLKNVHPLVIVGLFYYANDKDDSVMMWHLTDPASRVSSPEEYDKEIALLDATDSIRYNPSLIMYDGHETRVPIEFNRNGKTYYNVWMTYAEDQVWQVEKVVIEEGKL